MVLLTGWAMATLSTGDHPRSHVHNRLMIVNFWKCVVKINL